MGRKKLIPFTQIHEKITKYQQGKLLTYSQLIDFPKVYDRPISSALDFRKVNEVTVGEQFHEIVSEG